MAESDVGGAISTSQPRLAQELCNEIIHHLHEDKSLLAACGLVCRAWAISSRRGLFHSVVFEPGTQKATEFQQCLEHPSSVIASSIRHVELRGQLGTTFLAETVLKLPNVAHVNHLTVSNHGVIIPDTLHLLRQNFAHITALNVSGIRVESLQHFVLFACGFEFLETLSIHAVVWPARSEETTGLPAIVVLPPNLRSLRIDGKSQLLDVFVRSSEVGSVPAIETLDFGLVEAAEVSLIAECLQSLGSTVKCLSLEFNAFTPGSSSSVRANLF